MTTTSKNTDVEAVACCCNGFTNVMQCSLSVRAGADGNRTSDSSASNRITAEPRETCSVVPSTLTNTQTINAQHYALRCSEQILIMYVGVCLLLICSLLGDENIHNIDSINISAIVTDYSSNATLNRYISNLIEILQTMKCNTNNYRTDRL